jgi:hypothetical protein
MDVTNVWDVDRCDADGRRRDAGLAHRRTPRRRRHWRAGVNAAAWANRRRPGWSVPSSGNRQGQLRLRNPGVGIFGKSHFVPGPFSAQHVSIRITPSNIGYWRGLMPTEFLPQDQYGNHFLTLGAGTAEGDSSISCSGVLTKGLNRPNDVTKPPVELEKLAVGPIAEDGLIAALLSHHGNYPNDLPYACLPELNPGMYNSNSYAHGLLLKSGAPIPRFPYRGVIVPGWPIPVPSYKFDP